MDDWRDLTFKGQLDKLIDNVGYWRFIDWLLHKMTATLTTINKVLEERKR